MSCLNHPTYKGVPKKYIMSAKCAKCHKTIKSLKVGYSDPNETKMPQYSNKSLVPGILAGQKRDEDRRKHAIDMIQPYTTERGKIVENDKFRKYYPKEAAEMFQKDRA